MKKISTTLNESKQQRLCHLHFSGTSQVLFFYDDAYSSISLRVHELFIKKIVSLSGSNFFSFSFSNTAFIRSHMYALKAYGYYLLFTYILQNRKIHFCEKNITILMSCDNNDGGYVKSFFSLDF